MKNNIIEAADTGVSTRRISSTAAKHPPETTNKQNKCGGKASARVAVTRAAKYPPDQAKQGRQSIRQHHDGKASVMVVAAQADHGDDVSMEHR
jgi:hypothetical protein